MGFRKWAISAASIAANTKNVAAQAEAVAAKPHLSTAAPAAVGPQKPPKYRVPVHRPGSHKQRGFLNRFF